MGRWYGRALSEPQCSRAHEHGDTQGVRRCDGRCDGVGVKVRAGDDVFGVVSIAARPTISRDLSTVL